MDNLLNKIKLALEGEIKIYQSEYAQYVAEDYAAYRGRVGAENGIKRALEIISEEESKWVKGDDGLENE